MTEVKKPESQIRLRVGQDCASVITGFCLIILVVVSGYSFSMPTFGGKTGWSDLHGIIGSFDGVFGLSVVITLISAVLR